MDQALFALPILPGKTEAARAFLHEQNGPRKQELVACGQSVASPKRCEPSSSCRRATSSSST
jgi:hypothetical protein